MSEVVSFVRFPLVWRKSAFQLFCRKAVNGPIYIASCWSVACSESPLDSISSILHIIASRRVVSIASFIRELAKRLLAIFNVSYVSFIKLFYDITAYKKPDMIKHRQ